MPTSFAFSMEMFDVQLVSLSSIITPENPVPTVAQRNGIIPIDAQHLYM